MCVTPTGKHSTRSEHAILVEVYKFGPLALHPYSMHTKTRRRHDATCPEDVATGRSPKECHTTGSLPLSTARFCMTELVSVNHHEYILSCRISQPSGSTRNRSACISMATPAARMPWRSQQPCPAQSTASTLQAEGHLLGPLGKPLTAPGLDGVAAGGPALGIAVGRHPEILHCKAPPRAQQAAGRRQHQRRRVRHHLIRHRLACMPKCHSGLLYASGLLACQHASQRD